MNTEKNKLNLSIDLRLICGVLVAVIITLLLLWRPWQDSVQNTDRSISVTGKATVSAEPDLYVFYPSYNIQGKDNEAKTAALTKKNDEIVAKLKELGVQESDITTNASSYRDVYYFAPTTGSGNVSLSMSIETKDKELAQKVQDYLLTTGPTGQITPQYSFSKDKQKELESQARDEATKDARTKAEQTASNLGAKLGALKSVDESSLGSILPAYARDTMAVSGSPEADIATSSLGVQPGENDYDFNITVVYYIK